jgi:hypothetical protein
VWVTRPSMNFQKMGDFHLRLAIQIASNLGASRVGNSLVVDM